MAEIGKFNTLKVLRNVEHGVYLNGENLGDILLPNRYIVGQIGVDDEVNVFIYLDSEDRLIATNEKPYAQVGDFALLKVVSVNNYGSFLDWGLMKDVLVPFREQKQTMEEGKSYMVYIYVDEKTNRIAATAKLDRFLDQTPAEYEENQEVDLIAVNQTDMGYKVIVNKAHWGMLYKNEIFQTIQRGQHLKGYVKKVREDGKLDISLQKAGYERVDEISQKLLEVLNSKGGFIPVTDKTDADKIYALFKISKKTFKKAIGALYKQKMIVIEEGGIKLVD